MHMHVFKHDHMRELQQNDATKTIYNIQYKYYINIIQFHCTFYTYVYVYIKYNNDLIYLFNSRTIV